MLLLNGDIIDLWLTSLYHARKTQLFQYFESIAASKPVIWILGNHDAKASCPNSNIQIVSRYLLGSKQEILVSHGHQVYRGGNDSLLDRMLNKIVYWAWSWFKCDLQAKLNETNGYLSYIGRKRLKVLKAFTGFKYVIMGHTHVAGTLQCGETLLVDTGSCAITRSYAIVEEDLVQLKFF